MLFKKKQKKRCCCDHVRRVLHRHDVCANRQLTSLSLCLPLSLLPFFYITLLICFLNFLLSFLKILFLFQKIHCKIFRNPKSDFLSGTVFSHFYVVKGAIFLWSGSTKLLDLFSPCKWCSTQTFVCLFYILTIY